MDVTVLEPILPAGSVMLTLGIGGSAAIIGAALALGIRHGIDWDHIAAITDITSTTVTVDDPDEAWLTGEPGVMLTDESHHSLAAAPRLIETAQPVAVGAGITPSDLVSPATAAQVAPWRSLGGPRQWALPRVFVEQRRALLLGTLYAVGHGTVVTALGLLAILASEFLPAWIDPIMERVVGVTLILLAAYLFYAIYRFFRSGDEFRLRSRWMLVFAGVRNAFNWLRAKVRGEEHHGHVHAADQYGVRTAYAVGLIHGIGAETGTQVLIIATAVGAGTKAMGITALMAFVLGLVISNSFVTIASTTGFISARRRQSIYVSVGVLAACFSLAIGLLFLLQASDILPDLGQRFRWIGGPDA